MQNDRIKLHVAVPAHPDMVAGAHCDSLVELQAACIANGIEMTRERASSALLPKLRSAMAHRFLEAPTHPSHMLFVDADIGFQAEDVIAALRCDHALTILPCAKRDLKWRDMAVYAQSKPLGYFDDPSKTHEMVAAGMVFCFRFLPEDDPERLRILKDCMKVAAGGTGCMIIRRDVLETMRGRFQDLWYTDTTMGPGVRVCGLFECGRDKDGTYIDEDFAFSRRAAKCGYSIQAYVPAKTLHVGSMVYAGCFLDLMKQMGVLVEDEPVVARSGVMPIVAKKEPWYRMFGW